MDGGKGVLSRDLSFSWLSHNLAAISTVLLFCVIIVVVFLKKHNLYLIMISLLVN